MAALESDPAEIVLAHFIVSDDVERLIRTAGYDPVKVGGELAGPPRATGAAVAAGRSDVCGAGATRAARGAARIARATLAAGTAVAAGTAWPAAGALAALAAGAAGAVVAETA